MRLSNDSLRRGAALCVGVLALGASVAEQASSAGEGPPPVATFSILGFDPDTGMVIDSSTPMATNFPSQPRMAIDADGKVFVTNGGFAAGALFFREERGAVVGGARHPQAPCDTTTSDTSAGKASPSAWDSRPLRMLATAFSGVWPAARAQSR